MEEAIIKVDHIDSYLKVLCEGLNESFVKFIKENHLEKETIRKHSEALRNILVRTLKEACNKNYSSFTRDHDVRKKITLVGDQVIRLELLRDFLKLMAYKRKCSKVKYPSHNKTLKDVNLNFIEVEALIYDYLITNQHQFILESLSANPAFLSILCESFVDTRLIHTSQYRSLDEDWKKDSVIQKAVFFVSSLEETLMNEKQKKKNKN